MLKYEKSRLHLLRISVAKFFSLERVFSGSCFRLLAPSPPSILSLTTLMHVLEQTRARIRQEQIDRTQKRKNELRLQQKREEVVVRERTQPLIERNESLSRCLFESRREAFILRERTQTLSRSFLFLSRLCFLLCVCLAFFVVRQSADLCDERWLPEKANGHQRQIMVGHLEESPETESRVHYADNSRNPAGQGKIRLYRPMH
jgi:hypothetical protein